MSTTFTPTIVNRTVPGASYMISASLLGPTSYTTGGIVVNAALFNLNILDHVLIQGVTGARLTADWDDVNKKIILSYPTGGSTTPAALASPKVNTGASTASAVDATTPNVVAGVGNEVAAATNVSTVTVKVIVFGR